MEKTFEAIIARHGVLSVLLSDNGSQFNSTAFKEFSSQYHFKHILPAALGTPRAVG